ncbi:MAG: hypothetical protein CM1200mP33_0240 [Chloroflexota bacterium]|nr:MAG: hypothetical protein CM1200mP33_0240 [Chloroflexota bacterium]
MDLYYWHDYRSFCYFNFFIGNEWFEKRVIEKLIGFEGDIRITSNVDNNLEKIFNEINSDPSIDKALLYKERIGMIFAKNDSKRIVTFKSIDIENLDSFYNIDFINKGIDNAGQSIVIGNLLAKRVKCKRW